MKGVVNIEFILSVVVFLGTLSFITLTIGRDSAFLRESSLYDSLKANTIQISNLLAFDKGFPENWETGAITAVRRLGLSSGEKYVLSRQKIDRLQDFCKKSNPDYKKNYEKIKELLGLRGDINLTIATPDGTLLDCSPAVETLLKPKFSIGRIITVLGATEKKIGEFNITIIG
ncbi:MAG: hypothetical protein HYT72_05655 [Candidatus Aenigmarchaeota archaeon]|nr:hypothetical protein [Candidatus Aenigmarchaeota archaeon]